MHVVYSFVTITAFTQQITMQHNYEERTVKQHTNKIVDTQKHNKDM